MKYYITLNDEGEIMEISYAFSVAEKNVLRCFDDDEKILKIFSKQEDGDISVSYCNNSGYMYYEIVQCHFDNEYLEGYLAAKEKQNKDIEYTKISPKQMSTVYNQEYCLGWNNYVEEKELEKEADEYIKEHANEQ